MERLFGMSTEQLLERCFDHKLNGLLRLRTTHANLPSAQFAIWEQIIKCFTLEPSALGMPVEEYDLTQKQEVTEPLQLLFQTLSPVEFLPPELQFLNKLFQHLEETNESWYDISTDPDNTRLLIAFRETGNMLSSILLVTISKGDRACQIRPISERDLMLALASVTAWSTNTKFHETAIQFIQGWIQPHLDALTDEAIKEFGCAVAVAPNGQVWCADKVVIVCDQTMTRMVHLDAEACRQNKLVAAVGRQLLTLEVKETTPNPLILDIFFRHYHIAPPGHVRDQCVLRYSMFGAESETRVFVTTPDWVPPELLVSVDLPPELSKVPALRDAPPSE